MKHSESITRYCYLFRFRAFRAKFSRAVNRDEKFAAKSLADNKPELRLDHLVRERYPTFIDALHDLDDSLSLIYAYAHHMQSMNGMLPLI